MGFLTLPQLNINSDGTVSDSSLGSWAGDLVQVLAYNVGTVQPNSVTINSILPGSITSVALADGSVTTPKVADVAIDSAKLADASVTTQKLIDKIGQPTNSAFVATTGTLNNGTYYYRVTSINGLNNDGESLASDETSLAVSAGAASNGVIVNWGVVASATGYRVYGRTQGAELLLATINSGAITTWTDNGSLTPLGAMPTEDSTASIGSAQIGNATIVSALIGNAAILNANIANLAVTDAKINDLSAGKINAGYIAAARLDVTVAYISETAMIGNAVITGANIANATIGSANIALASIGAAQIALASITYAQIALATITAAQIANATITSAQIANATITTTQIASATIQGANIANLAVGTAQINNLAVTTAQIGNYAVTHNGTATSGGPTTFTASETILATMTVVTNTSSDTVMLWARSFIKDGVDLTGKSDFTGIVTTVRIRRTNTSGTTVDTVQTSGQYGLYGTHALIGIDSPGAIGTITYILTAQSVSVPNYTTGSGSDMVIMGCAYSK